MKTIPSRIARRRPGEFLRIPLLPLALLFLVCTSAEAREWTRFRGPNGQGISQATTIPDAWTEADLNWKTPLPGVGHSSPVVWDDKVFLLNGKPDGSARHVICIHAATGDIVWNKTWNSSAHHLHKYNSYASSTPAVDADHLYVAWATPEKLEVKALDHDGNPVWTVDLGRWVSQHGFATSPMLHGDLVILHNSQQTGRLKAGETKGDSSMLALNRKTGKQVWSTPLKGVWNCYAVPCIRRTADGGQELVCTSQGDGIFGLDPATGRFNWNVRDVFSRRVCNSPVLAGDLVIGSSGMLSRGEHIVAVRPGTDAEVVYRDRAFAPYVSSMIARGGLLFAISDRGIATCRDAKTGTMHWRERLGGNYFGSPVIVGDKLYCISVEGVVVVCRAGKTFEVISRNELGESSHSTPAVSGGRMFLRTFSHLISIGGEAK